MNFKAGLVIGIIIGLLVGILLGTYIQQLILKSIAMEVVEGLKETTFEIEIDLDETELIEKLKEVFIPVIIEAGIGVDSDDTK